MGHPPRNRLAELLGQQPTAIKPISGGSISSAYCLHMPDGLRLFAKTGSAAATRTFFAEADGLKELASAIKRGTTPCPLRVPNVHHVTDDWLVMQWLPPDPGGRRDWLALAQGLGALHHSDQHAGQAFRYGLDTDNFIGASPQLNHGSDHWPTFFANARLRPQVAAARRHNLWDRSWDRLWERLVDALPNELPAQPRPSLVHGDLWSGNVVWTEGGQAALIDPAVYWGDREVDLAMTRMFGGFASEFEQAYCQLWPLLPGFERRFRIYNLYHELNHLNLFGHSYAAMVGATLRRLT